MLHVFYSKKKKKSKVKISTRVTSHSIVDASNHCAMLYILVESAVILILQKRKLRHS